MLDSSVLEGLKKAATEANAIDRERAEAFQVMVASKGWVMFTQIINQQLATFGAQLLQPLESLDRAGLQEYMKGAMWAFALLRDLPTTTIQAMKGEKSDED